MKNLIMNIKNYVAQAIGNSGSKSEIEGMFTEDMYSTHVKMGVVVMIFEVMMILSSLSQGGPGTNLRRQIYFDLYLALIIITAIFMILFIYFHHRRHEKVIYQINLSFFYALCLCTWACAITLLDQHSGPNITVYSYVLMAASVFCFIKPWQSLLLFGGSFILLNGFAIALNGNPLFFSSPLKSYNFIINSFFTTMLTIIFAITLYHYRITKKHDKMVIQQQMDQIQLINQKLNDLAKTDQLTGLGNRRFLEEKIQELKESNQLSDIEVTGMMIDIDSFKQYNDNYGHQAGDLCLSKIAEILHKFVEEENAFAIRYGGEEFFLCLPGCNQPLQKADALRQTIMNQNLVRDDMPAGCVTVSIGVDIQKSWSFQGQDEFLRRCDDALYEAKKAGRNTVKLFQD